jgi:hypothetical protein
MTKRLSLVLAAVAMLTYAIPSMAGAAKATLPEGALAPVGTSITLTGTDLTFKSNILGAIRCATLNLNAQITENTGTVVEGSGSNVNPTQTGCVNGKKAFNITEVVITKLKAEEVKAAGESARATFSATIKTDIGELDCTFTGTKVEGIYVSGKNILKFSEASSLVGSPGQCGTSLLTGEFALEQAGTSNKLILD